MGQAKLKRQAAFSDALIAQWEAEQCINFAIALSRISAWLLQIDWWTPSTSPNDTHIPIEQLKPLRAYVADNGENVFDVRGVRQYSVFAEKTLKPLAMELGLGGVRSRFYSEDSLKELPLSIQPNPEKIGIATNAILANPVYLASIPKRPASTIPAHIAAEFSYGSCTPYAVALCEATGLKPIAMLAVRMGMNQTLANGSQFGYFHTVAKHPDGSMEDSWGRAMPNEIAARFGVHDFVLSEDEHFRIQSQLRLNSPELWEVRLAEAKQAIEQYRGTNS